MRKTSLVLLFGVSACGVVALDVPDVARSYAVTAQTAPGGGCGEGGALFKTQVSVAEMRQRMYGFRACVSGVENASITADVTTYEAGPSCLEPTGSASGLQLHLDYSEQGLLRTATVDCGGSVSFMEKSSVVAAINSCLSRVAAANDQLVEMLNAAAGVINVRLTGDCSADACFRVEASLGVELNGIRATNCL